MKNYLRIAIFASFVGLVTGLTYYTLRLGLTENSLWDVYKATGFLFFLLFTPTSIYWWAYRQERTQLILHPTVVLLLLVTFFVLIGLLTPPVFLIWLLASAGWLLFLFYLLKLLKASSWRELGIYLPITFLASLINAACIYCNLAKPHLFEALVAQHIPFNWPTDTLFHSSIVQMMNTYGMASSGLDGIPFINYHFGSHFIFSKLTNILGFDPLTFYTLGCPVIFSSLLYFVFLHAVIQVILFQKATARFDLNYLFWVLFFGIFFGFVKRGFIWHNGLQLMVPGVVANSSILTSESYLLSIILSFILFIILLARADNGSHEKDYGFYLLVLPALLFTIAITKISTGLIVFAVLFYLYFRYTLYRKVLFNLSFVLCFLGWLYAYYLVVEPDAKDGSISFEFFRENSFGFIIGFLILHYLWAYLLLGIYFLKESIFSFSPSHSQKLTNVLVQFNPFTKIYNSIKEKKTILVEVVFVIALAGFVPTALLSLNVNSNFFSEVQFFFASVVLLAHASTLDTSGLAPRVSRFVRKGALLLFLILCGYVFISNTKHFIKEVIDSNFLFRKTIVGDYSYRTIRTEIEKSVKKGQLSSADSMLSVYGKPVQASLDNSKEYAFMKKLRALSNLSAAEKKHSGVFIDYYHSGLTLYIPCYDMAFLVPALSGMAQLNGLYASETCKYLDGWTFNYYQIKSLEEREKLWTDQEICVLASSKGFKQVFVYKPDQNEFIRIQSN
jgi:hypothetical protein